MKAKLFGNNNPNWKGGKVLKVCQNCGNNYSGETSEKISKLWDYINILEIKGEGINES